MISDEVAIDSMWKIRLINSINTEQFTGTGCISYGLQSSYVTLPRQTRFTPMIEGESLLLILKFPCLFIHSECTLFCSHFERIKVKKNGVTVWQSVQDLDAQRSPEWGTVRDTVV